MSGLRIAFLIFAALLVFVNVPLALYRAFSDDFAYRSSSRYFWLMTAAVNLIVGTLGMRWSQGFGKYGKNPRANWMEIAVTLIVIGLLGFIGSVIPEMKAKRQAEQQRDSWQRLAEGSADAKENLDGATTWLQKNGFEIVGYGVDADGERRRSVVGYRQLTERSFFAGDCWLDIELEFHPAGKFVRVTSELRNYSISRKRLQRHLAPPTPQ